MRMIVQANFQMAFNVQQDYLIQYANEIDRSLSNELQGLKADIVANSNQINSASKTVSGLETMAQRFSNSIESYPNEILSIKKFIEFCVETGELPSFSTTSLTPWKPINSSIEDNKPVVITVPSLSSIEKYNGN